MQKEATPLDVALNFISSFFHSAFFIFLFTPAL